MITWPEIDRAARDGRLDKFLLPELAECRQVLDGLVNAQGGAGFHKLREHLYARVNELIRQREQEGLNNGARETEQKRHDEKLVLDREAITVSRQALEISKEANKISVDANAFSNKANGISEQANRISQKANTLSRWAVFVASLALLCSLGQCVSTWRDKATPPLPRTTLVTAQPTQEAPISLAPAAQTSNSTSTTSTNRTPASTPATNNP